MSTIYLAARFSRQTEMRAIRDRLEAAGHTVTSRWITGVHDDTTEGGLTGATLARFAKDDLADIDSAELIVVFSDQPSSKGGMWVELGYAMGRGTPVVIVGPAVNLFCHLTRCYPDAEAFLSAMEQEQGR